MRDGSEPIFNSMIAAARGLPLPWWLLTIAITVGTNALDFFAAAEGTKPGQSPAFIVSAIVRALLVFWLGYALLRRIAGVERPGRIGMPFLRVTLFTFGFLMLMGLCSLAGSALTGGGRTSAMGALVSSVIMALVVIALLRLYAWQAALAVGDRSLGPLGAWRALSGRHVELAIAYLPIALIAFIHTLLTRMALEPQSSTERLALLAAGDGIVSALQLILGCALSVAAWRAAHDRAQPLREPRALA